MRRVSLMLLLTLAVAGRASGGDFTFNSNLTAGDFANLAEVMADAVAFPVMSSAASSGVKGFAILAVAGGPRVDTGDSWWRNAVQGSTYGGIWTGGHVLVRKGLPWRLDVGGQVGEISGARFIGADARWMFVEEGALSPAVAVRASYTRLQNAPLALSVREAQLMVSKGFVVLTPYAAIGVRQVDANVTFGASPVVHYSMQHNRTTAAAGVKFGLVPFRFFGELRQGAKLGAFVGVGVGL